MDLGQLKTALVVRENEELEAKRAYREAQDKRIEAADALSLSILAEKGITPMETPCSYKRWGTPIRCIVEARNGSVTGWEITKANKKHMGRSPFKVHLGELTKEGGAA